MKPQKTTHNAARPHTTQCSELNNKKTVQSVQSRLSHRAVMKGRRRTRRTLPKKILDSFAKIWKKRLTHENSKSAKAFEVLLKLIGTALLLVVMILLLFVFLSAFFVYAFEPDTATQENRGEKWMYYEVDYFDTLSGGSYTSQTRMIP